MFFLNDTNWACQQLSSIADCDSCSGITKIHCQNFHCSLSFLLSIHVFQNTIPDCNLQEILLYPKKKISFLICPFCDQTSPNPILQRVNYSTATEHHKLFVFTPTSTDEDNQPAQDRKLNQQCELCPDSIWFQRYHIPVPLQFLFETDAFLFLFG